MSRSLSCVVVTCDADEDCEEWNYIPWFSHDLIQQRWTHPDGKDICPKHSRPSPDPEKEQS